MWLIVTLKKCARQDLFVAAGTCTVLNVDSGVKLNWPSLQMPNTAFFVTQDGYRVEVVSYGKKRARQLALHQKDIDWTQVLALV